MAAPKKIPLGAFPTGAVMPSLEHTFFQRDGVTPQNLIGFSSLHIRVQGVPPNALAGDGNLSCPTPASGVVVYEWGPNDMLKFGDFEMLIWVKMPSGLVIPSDLITYTVYDGPGVNP